MGYPLLIEAQGGPMMAYGAMRKAYRGLKETGRMSCDVGEIKMIRDEINDLVDLPKYWALEARTVEKQLKRSAGEAMVQVLSTHAPALSTWFLEDCHAACRI